jgi:hypothetical protein
LEVSSASVSKGFRSKTNLPAKSIRFAEEISNQNQSKNFEKRMQWKGEGSDYVAAEIVKERANISKLQ